MTRSLALVQALCVIAACGAGGQATRKALSQDSYCNPCQLPCVSGCVEAAAPAPAPKPPPPAPPPPPIEPAAAAAFDPPAGEYPTAQVVTLSSSTPGAAIHYTLDGSTPTADSPLYSAPIAVDRTQTVQAIAIAPGAPPSPVASATYTITPPPPPPPARVEVTKERLQLNEKVLFATGKSALDPASNALLDDVVAAMKAHPEVKHVVVEGHTDDRGGKRTNQKLSQARAEAVRRYLVDHGVEADRLAAKGFGPTRPIADNKTAEGREANRRVELVIQ